MSITGAEITCLSGSIKGRKIKVLPEESLKIGRGLNCDIQLDDSMASRLHASLRYRHGELLLEDQNSTNGIYVNGRRVHKSSLKLMELFLIGSTVFQVRRISKARPESISKLTQKISKSSISGKPIFDHTEEYEKLLHGLLHFQELLVEDSDPLMESNLNRIFELLPTSKISLFEYKNNSLTAKLALDFNGPCDPSSNIHFAEEIAQRNKPLLIPNLRDDPHLSWVHPLIQDGIHSILGIPLWLDDTLSGILICENQKESAPFDQGHLKLMEFICHSIEFALHIQKKKQLEKDFAKNQHLLELASRIQSQFIHFRAGEKRGPAIWSAHYEPALLVGGDFFDCYEDEDGVSWFISDVSGKGIPAAMVVSLLRGFCKVLLPEIKNPTLFLKRLNQLLLDELPREVFLTSCMIRLENNGTLSSCNAAHHPPVLLRGNGTRQSLPIQGMPLGIMPDHLFPRPLVLQQDQLRPGDRLFLFTDGLIDASNIHGEFFEEKKLLEHISSGRSQTITQHVDQLIEAIAQHRGHAENYDDITLVAGEML